LKENLREPETIVNSKSQIVNRGKILSKKAGRVLPGDMPLGVGDIHYKEIRDSPIYSKQWSSIIE